MEVINLSSLGPGIELLMNDKKKEKETITLTDIDKLEMELNDLSNIPIKLDTKETKEIKIEEIKLDELPKSDFPRTDMKLNDVKEIKEPTVRFAEPVQNKTWDGFKPFQGNPDQVKPVDTLKDRFTYLRKLEDLEAKGARLTRKYNMDSPLEEMKGEYENIISEKEKSNSVKFQGKMLMACITGIEFLNNKFDPFDIKLDGWAEQLNENLNDYDDIFSELHDKYRNKAKLAPELKLLFQLGGSAIMLHMTNTMFKSSIPGIDDIMRQNPELMQKFTQAAMSSMGANNPGFSGFMNSVQPPRPPARQESRQEPREVKEVRVERPEMKGPSDINDILNGLKPKTVQLDEVSNVSLSELNEMKEGLKKGRRKKSDKMSINLTI